MDDKIRTGIIGYGLSGKAFHAPFMHVHPGFEIKKVLERSKTESKKTYPYVEVVRDFQNLLQDQDIELLVHCTPNTLHFPLVKQSLEAGKHVIIEKPFTNNTKEADELISLSEKNKLKIFVYQNRRWDADFLTIRELLKKRTIGDITYFESHFDRYSPEIKDNWREENIAGSGVLFDLGPHLIDQVLCLFGMPQSIQADIKSQRKGSRVDDYFKIQLNYTNKQAVVTAGVLVQEIGPRFIIKGSKGIFSKSGLDPQEEKLRKGLMPEENNWGLELAKNWGRFKYNNEGTNIEERVKSKNGNYMGFYNNVFDVLKHKAEIMVQPIEARNVIHIIELAFKSSNENREIKIL